MLTSYRLLQPLLTLNQLLIELKGNFNKINKLLQQLYYTTITNPTTNPPTNNPTAKPYRALTKIKLYKKQMRLAQIYKPIKKDLGR